MHPKSKEQEVVLTKSISLAKEEPFELNELKDTGICHVFLSENLFINDSQGDVIRKIKSIIITIPSKISPYYLAEDSFRLLNDSFHTSNVPPYEGASVISE